MSGPDDRDQPPHDRDTLPELEAGNDTEHSPAVVPAGFAATLEGAKSIAVGLATLLRQQAAAARRQGAP
jgi:hypothetical protein